ncbi:MAG TPA: glycosyltransferase family 4 protein, partial [Stellaceae bacterium]|nr:glycosyltransferase family 4 protein [Stellaceae bacterium]
MPRPAAVIAYTSQNYDVSGGVAGRRAASAGFLNAYIRHAGLDTFTCFSHERADVEAFSELVTRNRGKRRSVVGIGPEELPRVSEIGTLYTPGPDLSRFAWLRRSGDQRGYSLVGVTHTLSEAAAMEAIGALLTAPAQAWDAVVCTTAVAKAAVTRLLDEYGEYLGMLAGTKLRSRVQLPVIPLGVDCDAFTAEANERADFRARHGIPLEDVVLLYVGRLDYAEKANPIALYLAAEQAAARSRRRIHLLEVGWFRAEMFAEAFAQAASVLAPSVNRIVLDSREPAHRRAWFAADIFVSLSDNIQETFGLTPVEAMAAGLPAVVSDWDGYRETVRDGVDGFRIPTLAPAAGAGEALAFDYAAGNANHSIFCAAASQSTAVDVVACTDALVRLIDDADLRRRMGEAGRRRARETFDWRVVIAAYQQLWLELAERRRTAPETAPVGAGRAARPLAMDPFTLFGEWPSGLLGADTMLTVSAGSDAALAGAMRRLWLAVPVAGMILDEAATATMM